MIGFAVSFCFLVPFCFDSAMSPQITNAMNAANELDELLGLGNDTAPANPLPAGQVASGDGSGFPPDFAKPRIITNPVSGAAIDTEDVDQLIEAFAILDDVNKRVYATLQQLRELIGAKTDGTAKTRRLVGQRLRVKVEMPDETWNNGQLKEAFNAYPQFRDAYLRIETVKPQLREVKKLKTMTIVDNPAMELFRDIVLGANQGPTGLPKVTVEG